MKNFIDWIRLELPMYYGTESRMGTIGLPTETEVIEAGTRGCLEGVRKMNRRIKLN